MSRLDDIKKRLEYDLAYMELSLGNDVEFLLKIAEAANDFVESFEQYNEDTYQNCITGPQRKCKDLRKALEVGDE